MLFGDTSMFVENIGWIIIEFVFTLISVTLVIACKFDSGIAGRATSYPRENIECSKSRQKLENRSIISEYRILIVNCFIVSFRFPDDPCPYCEVDGYCCGRQCAFQGRF